MTTKKTFKEKILAVFLMIAVTVTMIPASFALMTEPASAATKMSFTTHWDLKGGGDKSVRFNGVSGTASAGYYGLCAKAGYKHYESKHSYNLTDVRNHDFGKLAYYYGYIKGWTKGENGCKLSRALNYVNNYDKDSSYAGKAYHFSATTLKNMRDNAREYCKSHPIPSNFHVYYAKPSDGSRKQTGIVWKMDPYGYLTGVKTSTDSKSTVADSGYTFEGIQYKVYSDAACTAAVGTLTCNASGKMDTLTLSPGTYYVKESATNSSYKLSDQVYTVGVKSSSTASFTAKDTPETAKIYIEKEVTGSYEGDLAFHFTLTNIENPSIKYNVTTDANTGKAELNVVIGTYRCEEELTEEQTFVCLDVTGAQNSTKLKPGDTYTFKRVNKSTRAGTLNVSKAVGDDGPLDGFKFKVTGILYNQGEMTADKLLEVAAPAVTEYDTDAYELGEWKVNENDLKALNEAAKDGNKTESKKSENMKVKLTNKLSYKTGGAKTPAEIVDELDPKPQPADEVKKGTIAQGTMIKDGDNYYIAENDVKYDFVFTEEIEADPLAEPPVEGKESEFDVNATIEKIKNLLGDTDKFRSVDTSDVNISIEVPVKLKDVEYVYDSGDPEAAEYETDLEKQVKNAKVEDPVQKLKYTVNFKGFDWFGASTVYREIEKGKFTGNNFCILTTDEAGIAKHILDGEYMDGIDEGITYGRFTVEEQMTDSQAKRYHQPEKQTQEVKDGKASFIFDFKNEPRWTPVNLVKTCIDGNIAGIDFTVTGTRDFDEEEVEIRGVTDEFGKIDFGNIYAGSYTITETGFNINNYKRPAGWTMNDDGKPYKQFKVTGTEENPVSIEIENIPQSELYLTKVDKDTQSFLDGSEFELYENGEKVAIFKIVRDDFANTGIDLVWKAEGSDIYAPKPIVTPPDPEPEETEVDGKEGDPDDITPIVVAPDGDEEMGGVGEDENPVEEIEGEYNFGCLKGLTEGAEYTLKEVKAPEGYAATISYPFTFENTMKIVLENQKPEIGTTALDKDTGQHMSDPHGMRTIIDTVEYKHLEVGREYKMSGMLMYKTEGDKYAEAVKDANGREITAEKTFTPETADGTIDIEFTFDASLLDGAKTVVFEELYEPQLFAEDLLIAVHNDENDEGQSIYFPEIKTTALADDTKDHITNADNEIIITDTVEYSNIFAGKIYEMTGTLMNSETGEKVLDAQGNEISSTQRFKATEEGPILLDENNREIIIKEGEEPQIGEVITEDETGEVKLASGTVKLSFTFDGSRLAGTRTVVFEHLFCGGKLVGEHSDPDDEGQTVEIPALGTKASTNGKDAITDKVAYKGLIPGKTYIMRGQLMDKDAETPLEGDEYTAELEFTPQAPDGIVELTFDISEEKLRGKTIVVFETGYIIEKLTDEQTGEEKDTEIEIGSHRDLEDSNQTIYFKVPQTGQTFPWILAALLGLILVSGAVYVYGKRKNSTDEKD